MKTQWLTDVVACIVSDRILTKASALVLGLSAALCAIAPAQTNGIYGFLPVSGGNPAVDAALDGITVYDSFRGEQSHAYAGEMGLVFADQGAYTGSQTPANTFRTDTEGPLSNQLGLWGYCVDWSSPWKDSTTQSRLFRATTVAEADQIYQAQGVAGYSAGGLFRAAYLIDSYASYVNTQNHIAAAALQAAIWEVLYDANPSVSQGQGTYFLRNQLPNSDLAATMSEVLNLANGYLSAAESENWGYGSFDANNRVVVWMTTDLQTSSFQSLLTVNPQGLPVQYGDPVPEPGSALLALLAAPLALFRCTRH